MSVVAALLLALLPAQKPSSADVEASVARAFEAPEAERAELLGKLKALPPLKPAEAREWTARLLKLARRGTTSPLERENFLYDEKAKKGRYLVQGKGNALLIGLHGGGGGVGDAGNAQSQWGGSLHGLMGVFPEVTEKSGDAWGTDREEAFVLDLLETLKRTVRLDTNRVYLVGHSMGGFGAWTIGARNADLFAGIAPFAGAITPQYDPSGKIVGLPEGLLPNLRNVAVWVYHSLDDPRVKVDANQYAVARLEELSAKHGGFEHVYDEQDKRGHGLPAKGCGPAVEWLVKHRRDPRPKKVVWEPRSARKRMFYWLARTGVPAGRIVAEVRGPNHIAVEVAPGAESGWAVLLDQRLVDLAREVRIDVNGEERFRGVPPLTLAALVESVVERRDPELVFPARIELRR
jgi:predicted esterase